MLRRVMLVTAVVGLAAPAAASAATYTVDAGAAAGCDASNVCKTIRDAAGKVADGDVVEIKDGAYVESGPIVVTKSNVTFKGTAGKVTVTQTDGKPDTPVFSLGNGNTLDGLIIGVQPNGAEAVVAAGGSATIRNSTLARLQTSSANAAVLASTAPAGVVTVQSSAIIQAPPSTGATPDAVRGSRGSSLAIIGSSILCSTGAGVVLTGKDANTGNSIVNSQILTTRSDGDAVVVASPADQAAAQQVHIDSSILGPGTDGTGIIASSAASSESRGGPVTVSGVHVTIAGGAAPVEASAGAQRIPLGGGVAGPVEVSLDRSIVHGRAKSTVHTETAGVLGVLPIGPRSVASVRIASSDATDTTGAGVTVTDSTTSSDEALFVSPAGRNYHLRIGSPAIDKAGPLVGGESDKDVDLQPRLTGAATDYGADEFLNLPPIPSFTSSTTMTKTGQVVRFDASKSVDLEGGVIASYKWNFGDGSVAETTGPTTEHAYAKPGAYTPTLVVTDPQGNTSAPRAGAPVTVADGTPPAVTITTPKNTSKRRIFSTKRNKKTRKVTRTRQRFAYRGTAKDANGVATVAISLRRVSLAKKAGAAQARACVYLDKTRFVSRNCKRPVYFFVNVDNDGFWAFRTKKATRFRAGTYELTVVARDKDGNVSAPVTVTFTLV